MAARLSWLHEPPYSLKQTSWTMLVRGLVLLDAMLSHTSTPSSGLVPDMSQPASRQTVGNQSDTWIFRRKRGGGGGGKKKKKKKRERRRRKERKRTIRAKTDIRALIRLKEAEGNPICFMLQIFLSFLFPFLLFPFLSFLPSFFRVTQPFDGWCSSIGCRWLAGFRRWQSRLRGLHPPKALLKKRCVEIKDG